MITATLEDLHNNFSRFEIWLKKGERIQIENRGQPVAILTGIRSHHPVTPPKPNFAARRRAIWGERLFSEAEVAAMRADELENEKG